MKRPVDLTPIRDFLPCATPRAWLHWARAHPDILLVDHANCEKKAASTALNLMYRYVEHDRLLNRLSRLAREELRHFELVLRLMRRRGVTYPQLSASRYAAGLREPVRTFEPARLVDTLLVGAIIEARSCERFAALVPEVDGELAAFYTSLLRSESRHFMDYLALAEHVSSADEVAQRLPVFLARERELIEGADGEFRFHSGVPPADAAAATQAI